MRTIWTRWKSSNDHNPLIKLSACMWRRSLCILMFFITHTNMTLIMFHRRILNSFFLPLESYTTKRRVIFYKEIWYTDCHIYLHGVRQTAKLCFHLSWFVTQGTVFSSLLICKTRNNLEHFPDLAVNLFEFEIDFFCFLNPCLLVILWKIGWTHLHENFMVYQAGHK